MRVPSRTVITRGYATPGPVRTFNTSTATMAKIGWEAAGELVGDGVMVGLGDGVVEGGGVAVGRGVCVAVGRRVGEGDVVGCRVAVGFGVRVGAGDAVAGGVGACRPPQPKAARLSISRVSKTYPFLMETTFHESGAFQFSAHRVANGQSL